MAQPRGEIRILEWPRISADVQIMSRSASNGPGRPPHDREALLAYLWTCPRRGRNLVKVNERQAAAALGWHRTTVGRALDDLEEEGAVERFSRLGHAGLIVKLLAPPLC
jgi:hypothetical protein